MAQAQAPVGGEWLEDYVLQFMKGKSWADPINTFVEDKCSIFDVTNTEENKLEYTIVHNEFKEIVESLLVAHLLDVDVSPDQFIHSFAAAFESNVNAAKADSRLNDVVNQIVGVSDFMVFKQMMITKHLCQQRAAADGHLPQESYSGIPCLEPPVPNSSVVSAPMPAAAPSALTASRIASIIQNATKEKSNNTEKAEMVRAALAVSAGRMKAVQGAGA